MREDWGRVTGCLEIVAPDLRELAPAAASLRAVGSLRLVCAGLERLSLPALATVDGILDLPGGGLPVLREVELPALSSCGRMSVWGCPRLESLRLPALATCGALHVASNPELTGLDLPQLQTITGSSDCDNGTQNLSVADCLRLARLRFPALRTVSGYWGGIAVSGVPALGEIELPVLSSVASRLEVLKAPSLERLDLPALEDARAVKLNQNAALRHVGLPSLSVLDGPLEVCENPVLAGLELPRLERLYSLHLQDNAALGRVGLPALARIGFNVNVFENRCLREFAVPALKTMNGWLWAKRTPLPENATAAMKAAGAKPAPDS
ncbi:MAG TPA: hypothetical protein VGK67_11840 [Myxococcales bacterium]